MFHNNDKHKQGVSGNSGVRDDIILTLHVDLRGGALFRYWFQRNSCQRCHHKPHYTHSGLTRVRFLAAQWPLPVGNIRRPIG